MSALQTVADIPLAWQKELADLRAVCPTAVLAGGALRDLDNGREVKDLDIFIRAMSEREALCAIELLNASGFHVEHQPSDLTSYPEDQNLEVVLIANVVGSDETPPVQLIFTNWDTDRIVERFDYGICRVAFDGTNLVVSDDYIDDREAQVFRLRRDRPTAISMRGSIHRYARLTADKYPGWTWWPYGFDEEFEAL